MTTPKTCPKCGSALTDERALWFAFECGSKEPTKVGLEINRWGLGQFDQSKTCRIRELEAVKAENAKLKEALKEKS